MQYYLNAREWLEAQCLRMDRIADFAVEILNTWLPYDEIEECEEVVQARNEADALEAKLAQLEKPLERSRFASEFVTTDHDETGDEFEEFLEYVAEQDEKLYEIRQVLVRSGVLGNHDIDTDLAALIVMFVPPIDE